MENTIATVARRRGEFRAEAYFFTLDALHSSVEELSVRRHLSGPELLQGIVRLANGRFGKEAAEILNGWGISCTRDFGVIVYDLIEAGILSKTEDDQLEDFEEVFNLSEALKEELWRQKWHVGDSFGYGGPGGGILD